MTASRIFSSIILLILSIVQRISTQEIVPNAVNGDPFVNCAADAIYVKLKTNFTFGGHISVRFAPNRFCYQVLVTNNQIEVLIPHEECSITRRRSISPPGVVLEAALVVSFHPDFTTADDRVFALSCFHTRKEKGLEPGSATVPPQSDNIPHCSYNILNSMGGRPVGTVSLGQRVYHNWECSNLKGRNCALVAGEERHQIVGGDGCSKDTRLLPNLHYFNQSFVGQNVSVFGISGASLVFFECEVLLLPSVTGRCQTPICDDVSEASARFKREIAQSDAAVEVRSQRIEISALGLSEPSVEENSEEKPRRSAIDERLKQTDTCVPISAFAMIIAAAVSVLALIIFLVGLGMLHRYRHYNMANSAT